MASQTAEQTSAVDIQTVTLPQRKRKNGAREYTADEVAAVIQKLKDCPQGQGIAFDPNLWLDSEGKARTKAREMALLVVAHKDGKSMGQPRTHVIPHPQNGQTNEESGEKYKDRFTPVISPKR
jgi:hypothetical protein